MRHLGGGIAISFFLTAPVALAGNTLLSLSMPAADLSVASTTGAPGIGGTAALNVDLAGLATKIKGDAHASRSNTALAGENGKRSAALEVDSNWHHGIVALALKAQRKLDINQHDGPTTQTLYVAHSVQQNDSTDASATLTLKPVSGLTLAATAQNTSTNTIQSETFVGQASATSQVASTRAIEAFMATWKPLPQLTAQADARLAEGSLRLQNSSLAQLRWQAAEPRLALALTPFSGLRLSLAIDRSVVPVGAADLAAWHAATGDLESGLRPNTADEIHAGIDDQLGALSAKAAFTAAALSSTTVLAEGPGGQLPQSISGGSRQSAHFALALSMAPFGFSHAKLSSRAAFRHSQIRDPVTGRDRALSGQVPAEASVKLTDALKGSGVSFGLDGQMGTRTHYYQVAEDSAITNTPSAGAFIKYNPGPFALTLSVSGLGGATDQQNYFYQGSRAGRLAAISRSAFSSTTVGLSFSKALED